MNFPNMCNGANLSFTKKSFLAVKGYEGNTHIPSGDDEFLMHKIYNKYPGKVYFLKSENFIVTTKAKDDLKSLFYQRRRWAGKWKLYSDFKISLFAAFYFLFNLVFFASFLMMIFGEYHFSMFLVQFVARLVVDFVFLRSIMKFLKQPFSVPLFIVAEIIYPFYILILGIASNFGNYEWKGRKIK
ncbi:MAG: glycosyl transferase family 2, partial [Bacteroidota bacterium]|nr:glycosyl transferase family 2 [Bacteroidota bacterium]